jgi:hypothetical protein
MSDRDGTGRLTVSELLLKAHADEHEAGHVDDQVQNAGVQPHAGDEAPALVLVHDLLPYESPHLGEPAENKYARQAPSSASKFSLVVRIPNAACVEQ